MLFTVLYPPIRNLLVVCNTLYNNPEVRCFLQYKIVHSDTGGVFTNPGLSYAQLFIQIMGLVSAIVYRNLERVNISSGIVSNLLCFHNN